ncbi:GntR family transcriptional regulator [Streptomyces sp. NPDC008313]|uniref:GntR family transcriptional regulator n=1 Tax=Streptomyces sp. NPDC008313 TaxID=3364826 RepID=UPI0036EC9BA3
MLKRERVREHLLGLIEAGRPRDAIPSERTLCATLDVSRPTLRAAVDELVNAGLLVREHGRGMFIAPGKITQELASENTGFTLPRASGTWTSSILELTTLRAGARIGRKLGLSPATELLYIARLRLVDGIPMAIEHLHIPAEFVPDLTRSELEVGELYDHLRDHHGIHVHRAEQSIEPTVINETEAETLGTPVLSAALLIERLTTDTHGRPVEYVRSVYRGDRYRIVSHLALGGSAPRNRPGAHHPGIPPGDPAHRGVITSSTTGAVQPNL